MRERTRAAVFGAVAVACVAGSALAVLAGVRGASGQKSASPGVTRALETARERGDKTIVYLSRGDGASGGRLAIAPLGRGAGSPERSSMSCERVYFAAGAGICVARRDGFAAGYGARIFGSDLRVRREVPVAGIPSRARVSPDGRLGTVTMFVTGHSYAAAGAFSTETTLIDLRTGAKLGTLEDFTVRKGDRQVTAVDVNFWGVTFARDGDTFYATMATGGKTYLIRGSVSAREADVVKQNVECPSLSPDGTRIAYKRATGDPARPWRLTVLDLATMRDTPLAERRSVDDQVEWRDDDRVLYGVDRGVWTAPADGSGRPERLLAEADSPAAVRW